MTLNKSYNKMAEQLFENTLLKKKKKKKLLRGL